MSIQSSFIINNNNIVPYTKGYKLSCVCDDNGFENGYGWRKNEDIYYKINYMYNSDNFITSCYLSAIPTQSGFMLCY